MSLWIIAPAVFLLNLPFGYWRASTKKYSWQWMLAVLLAMPLVIALGVFAGLNWNLLSIPVLAEALFLGQFVGGKVRLLISGKGPR